MPTTFPIGNKLFESTDQAQFGASRLIDATRLLRCDRPWRALADALESD
jgi:hypothetical protein